MIKLGTLFFCQSSLESSSQQLGEIPSPKSLFTLTSINGILLFFFFYTRFHCCTMCKVGCLGYPGASTGSQPAPRQSATSMAGNPCNSAMSPHLGPTGTCHLELTLEKKGQGEGGNAAVNPAKKSTLHGNHLRVQNYML